MQQSAWPKAVTWDAVSATSLADLHSVLGALANVPSVLLIAGTHARRSGWTSSAAIELVDRMGAHQSSVLLDLVFSGGELHEQLGTDSIEGVADIFLYGASLKHVLHRPSGLSFEFAPAGLPADTELVLTHRRWYRLLGEVEATGARLFAYVRAEAPGLEALARRIPRIVVLGGTADTESISRRLAGVATCVAVIAPTTVETLQANNKPAAPPTLRRGTAEEFESIRVPRKGAREALLADLRNRQRDALRAPVAPTEPPEKREKPPARPAEKPPARAPERPEARQPEAAPGRPREAAPRKPKAVPARPSEAAPPRQPDKASALPPEAVPAPPAKTRARAPRAPARPPEAPAQPPPEAAPARARGRPATRRPEPAPAPVQPSARKVVAAPPDDSVAAPVAPPAFLGMRQPPLTEPTFAAFDTRLPVRTPSFMYAAIFVGALLLISGGWFLFRDVFRGSAEEENLAVAGSPDAGRSNVVPLPYSVAVESHNDLSSASERVETLRNEAGGEIGFYIAPLLVNKVRYYRVMAGPVADSAEANLMLRRLLENGQKTGSNPSDVRQAPLAFVLGDYDSRYAAHQREREVGAASIPAYVVQIRTTEGRTRYRVYAGTYSSPAEADIMRRMLKEAGLPDSLVERVGIRR
jgi:sporulation related protein